MIVKLSLYDFLPAVVRGEYAMVKGPAYLSSLLLLARNEVTDFSGRTFENISGFEYALWALDKHMWAGMISFIPTNAVGRKTSRTIDCSIRKTCHRGDHL